jgi:ElaB/YqjD/DUF883 family membrane-anchored ribosome-binding protein
MSNSSIEATLNDAQAQIRDLRSQLNTLMSDRVEPVLKDYAGRAGRYADKATKMAREEADVASEYVRERPITIVLAAAAIGYVIARLTR